MAGLGQLQEQGRFTGPMASMAKMNRAQKAGKSCWTPATSSVATGLLLEHHVARHLTDMEVVHTYEGTDSIQAIIVGRDLTGICLQLNRGNSRRFRASQL